MIPVIDNSRFRKLLLVHPTAAVRLLHGFYAKNLFHLAQRMVRDRDAAKDIVQDTFLVIWANRKKLAQQHDRSVEHYLVRIVRNKAVSYYYRSRRLRSLDLLLSGRYDEPYDSPDAGSIQSEIIAQIRQAILTFPLRERQCLLMKVDQQLSVEQMAVQLGITKKAVERNITSAYKRLRRWAEQYF